MTGRPVVVNSLLCFLSNYREQENIARIVERHFTMENIQTAYQILLDLVPERDRLTLMRTTTRTITLIELFDRVNKFTAVHDHPPVFATDDLTVLPLSLNYDDTMGRPKDLYDEVRQLRLYVQNTFERKQDDQFGCKRNPNEQTTKMEEPECKQLSSSSSVASPQILSSSNSVISSGHQFHVSALLQDKPSAHESPLTHSVDSKPVRRNSRGHESGSPKRRKEAGNRLDLAVRRLTDRLGGRQQFDLERQFEADGEEEDANLLNNNTKSSPNSRSLTPPDTSDCNDEMDNESVGDFQRDPANNNNSVLVPNLVANHNAAMFNGADGILSRHAALLDRVKSAAAAAAAMVDPVTAQAFQNFAAAHLGFAGALPTSTETTNADLATEDLPTQVQSDEFGEENEKSSGESSPAPSDSSVPPESGDNVAEADKPFACSQPNCKKRFSNKFLLKKHQFIHTGLRPHSCPFCSKQFNRKDNCLRHKKTHLHNALNQLTGRRRHNMLYVSEEAANLANFPLFRPGALINGLNDGS
ncbi:hypothetical protein M3Y99_00330000 [Aphelenchoides fujianensis]|nr:hypothetical protein M3Y99_00330000 [Aphelenchoides fujianensis]